MRTYRFPTPLAILALGLSATVQAQMYSWKDANGKVHYGDRPPVEKQAEVRKLKGAPIEPSDAAAIRKSTADRQFDQREKQAAREADAKKSGDEAAQSREREESCKRARSNLAGLESGHIRFGLSEQGERVALDGASRDAELSRARKMVGEWCSPPAAK